jgi:maleylacetoacetate isomerase
MRSVKLYSYWRSTAAYRVRIALNLKCVPYDTVPVHLVENGGEQNSVEYGKLNPSHLVPTLVLEDGTALTQSLAIIEYLDQTIATNPLLPNDPLERAMVTAAAHVIAVDTHPVNNLRVAQYLSSEFAVEPPRIADWMNHWTGKGLTSVQALVQTDTKFAFGNTPTIADICLTAQLYNARRWGLDLDNFARLAEIEQNCLAMKAFDDARPENQIDAPATP